MNSCDVIVRYRLEWWKNTSGALMSSQCQKRETAEFRMKELAEYDDVVEVRIIEERMIAQHINGNGSCGDIHVDG
jgi:hypothetical protein